MSAFCNTSPKLPATTHLANRTADSRQQTLGYISISTLLYSVRSFIMILGLLPYFSIDNAHIMYNAHPKLMYTAHVHFLRIYTFFV